MTFKIYLARPRGFCAGVDRAVRAVELALRKFGKPVYVKHAIVHNRHVVRELEDKGAIFVEDPNDIPEGAVVIFSAHGSPPEHYEIARRRRFRLIDATCPLVHKVHREARRFVEEGYHIVYVGHKNHVEAIGVKGEAPDRIDIIETKEEALRYDPPSDKLALLTQTTLSVDDTREIIGILRRRFPGIVLPPREDICYATQNRQDAVKRLATISDVVLVVGSRESSNSNRLKEVAQRYGARSYLIEDEGAIREEWLEGVRAVGVTSGASTPERLAEKVIERLKEMGGDGVEEIDGIVEKIRFALPKEVL